LAALFGVPIGLLGGVYLAEFGGRTVPFLVRYTADLMNGVPSIIMGIFAYALVVMPMHHFSTLAGGIALAIMVIPTVLRNTESFLRDVPSSLREGSFALGANKWRMSAPVFLPAASRGILTGVLLALARVAGETAPLIFTAFGNRYWSPGWMQPTSSLPVIIYTYATGPYEDWHRQAWAAGLVLLGLVLVTNILVRTFLSGGTSFERVCPMNAAFPLMGNSGAAVSAASSKARVTADGSTTSAPGASTLRMKITRINFYYGKNHALHNVSLDVATNR